MNQSLNDGYRDFNWAVPQRKDLMSLSNIQNNTRQRRKTDESYKYIDVTKPALVNKVSYANRSDDVDGARPGIFSLRTRNCNRITYGLEIDDIKGTRPQICKFQTKRSVNPLEPQYHLPKARPTQILNHKFVRDSMNISDIDGSQARINTWQYAVRNVDPYTEIEGSKPKQIKSMKHSVDNLDVTDINQKAQPKYKNNNPLDPQYNINGSYIGFVDGSKPRNRHPSLHKEQSLSLNTDQIRGCRTNTVQDSFLHHQTRKDFIQTNKVNDIPGTQVGTCIKGLRTKRQVNPLNPTYTLAST